MDNKNYNSNVDELEKFKNDLSLKIENGEISSIESFCLGVIKIVLLNVNNEIEMKRFIYILKQCDLKNMKDTILRLSKANFIKDIKYRYYGGISLKNNIKCLILIKKIKIILHLMKKISR